MSVIYPDLEKLKKALRKKTVIRRVVESPEASKSYYLPETGWIDLSSYGVTGFLIYSPDGDPLSCQVELSDGEDSGDLVGYAIQASDYVVGAWNSIIMPEALALNKIRLRVTTGSTPPTKIKMIAVLRP